jgi:GT2 family glycosyltransferase/glycosyltransferase involved in cell wall biosynthesis
MSAGRVRPLLRPPSSALRSQRSTLHAPRSTAASIIIPVFNQVALTTQCLQAIVGREDCEIIVVDDGSTDLTPQTLMDFGECLKVVEHAANTGFAQSCNDGAAQAHGQYLVFLNNDTIPQPGWLEALIGYADSHPEAAVVGAKLLYPNNTIQHAGVVICQDKYPRHVYTGFPADHPAVTKSRRFQIVTAACMLVRRRAFDELGGFNTEFRNGFEDVDLCLRAQAAGHEIHYCAESVLVHLESATSGRRKNEGDNYRLYNELWKDRVRPDDFSYYLEDQLISVSYEGGHPFHLNVSPSLAVIEGSARQAESEEILIQRARQVAELTRENMHLRVALGQDAPKVAALEYPRLRGRIRDAVLQAVPAGATILVVTKGDGALLELEGRKAWHFPRTEEGAYAGYHPADSSAAIAHLEQLRQKGAEYLVVPQTSFWWLTHYKEFGQYLAQHCRSLLNSPDSCAIFGLGQKEHPLASLPAEPLYAKVEKLGQQSGFAPLQKGRRKVLYVSHNHPRLVTGGAEVYAFELYQAMRLSGDFEPLLLARAEAVANASEHAVRSAQILRCGDTDGEYLFYSKRSEFDPFYLRSRGDRGCAHAFREFLRKEHPDVVHFQHTHLMGCDLVGEARQLLPDAAIVYTLHEYLPICYRNGLMIRSGTLGLCRTPSPDQCHGCFPDVSLDAFIDRKQALLRHLSAADLFLAPSRFLMERYVEWGIPPEKIRFEEYGRHLFRPCKDSIPDRPRNRFGYFGQLNWFKGVDVLLEAIAILTASADAIPSAARAKELLNGTTPSPQLCIHGANLELQGEEFQAKFKASLGALKDSVTFAGPYSRDELPRRMANTDWVVVPSLWWENSPLVIQEAFGHGRPVICSDIGAMREKVEDGRNGLHFRAGDARSLAQTMQRAITSPGLWESLVDGIPKVYPMDEHISALKRLYEELLERR